MHKKYVGLLLQIVKPYHLRREKVFRNRFIRLFSSESQSFDPYEVLEVEPGSSFDTIRDQYMKLSKRYHPDYNPGSKDAEAKFITITKAYKSLVDNIEKNANTEGRHTESAKSDYDFTVEPLGVETEIPKPVSFARPIMTFVIICISFLAAVHVLRNVTDIVSTSIEERMSRKTIREQEKQIMEETRQAIIKYHRKKEKLKELYEKAAR